MTGRVVAAYPGAVVFPGPKPALKVAAAAVVVGFGLGVLIGFKRADASLRAAGDVDDSKSMRGT